MKESRKSALLRSGWKVGSVAEFLELSPEEIEFVETKLALARALRERRVKQKLSQTEFAKRVGSSQSRVAKMEAGDRTVSLDLLVRSLFASGATSNDLARVIARDAVEKRAVARTGRKVAALRRELPSSRTSKAKGR
jgi:transcriptional regulator with XRE-family HTH domain